jgi:hypothetical protein
MGRPCGVRVRRHVDLQHTAALEREDKDDVDDVECDRRHRQKVDRDRAHEVVRKVLQVCDGGRRGRPGGLGSKQASRES